MHSTLMYVRNFSKNRTRLLTVEIRQMIRQFLNAHQVTIGHVQHATDCDHDDSGPIYPQALVISPRIPGCDMLAPKPPHKYESGASGATWEATGEIYSTLTGHQASIPAKDVKTALKKGPSISAFLTRYALRTVALPYDQGICQDAANVPRFHVMVYGHHN